MDCIFALSKYTLWESITASKTHAGYFAEDKNHHLVNSKEGKESESDTSAYDLILKNKEQLLSFAEPVRFIFSHSALREGWDNPNVFVMCPLKKPDAGNDVARRQEVGRGLRLCVDQNGDRQDDPAIVHDVNILTVVANEEFSTYVDGLQKEIMDACARRPVKADVAFFTDKIVYLSPNIADRPELEQKHRITAKEANVINFALKQAGYVDIETDEMLPKWRIDRASECLKDLVLPVQFYPYKESLIELVDSVYDKNAVRKHIEPRRPKPLKTNANFAKDAFKELWKRINHKTAYTVEFSSAELIKKSIEALDHQIDIPKLTYTVRKAMQTTGNTFAAGEHKSQQVDEHYTDTGVKYDLIGKVAEGTTLTRYDETSDTITAVYKFVPTQDAPRTFSKLRLVAALDSQGLWSAFRDWMVEQEYYDLFLAAQSFREDHPSFSEVMNAAKSRFNLTDDQCAALLDAAVADT